MISATCWIPRPHHPVNAASPALIAAPALPQPPDAKGGRRVTSATRWTPRPHDPENALSPLLQPPRSLNRRTKNETAA